MVSNEEFYILKYIFEPPMIERTTVLYTGQNAWFQSVLYNYGGSTMTVLLDDRATFSNNYCIIISGLDGFYSCYNPISIMFSVNTILIHSCIVFPLFTVS